MNSPRNLKMFLCYILIGHTYREIAAEHGITSTRSRQIIQRISMQCYKLFPDHFRVEGQRRWTYARIMKHKPGACLGALRWYYTTKLVEHKYRVDHGYTDKSSPVHPEIVEIIDLLEC